MPIPKNYNKVWDNRPLCILVSKQIFQVEYLIIGVILIF